MASGEGLRLRSFMWPRLPDSEPVKIADRCDGIGDLPNGGIAKSGNVAVACAAASMSICIS